MVKQSLSRLYLIAMAGLWTGLSASMTFAADETEQYLKLKDWSGKGPMMKVAVAVDESWKDKDYALEKYGDGWDFNEEDTEGIDETGPGIKDLKVENGVLCFTTGEDNLESTPAEKRAYIQWGDFSGQQPGYGLEEIDANGFLWLMMRVKQSGTGPNRWRWEWRFDGDERWQSSYYDGPRAREHHFLAGDGWQTVSWDLWIKSKKKVVAFRLYPGGAGNKVEIDWMRLTGEVKPDWYVRRTVDIDTDAFRVWLAATANPTVDVWINGEHALTHGDPYKRINQNIVGYTGIHTLDIKDFSGYFRKGKNVICARVPEPNWLMLQGMVFPGDGVEMPIYVDDGGGKWKGSLREENGWLEPDFDDSGWSEPQVWGSYRHFNWSRRPYFGPVEALSAIDNREAVAFGEDEGIKLKVRIPANLYAAEGYEIRYAVIGEFEDDELLKEGTAVQSAAEGGYRVFSIEYPPPQRGVYDVYLALTRDNEIYSRRLVQVAVVGEIKQKTVSAEKIEEAMGLELVDRIDPVNPEDSHPFLSGCKTAIVDSPAGKYMEPSENQYAWMSWKFTVKNLYRPHLIVLEYPDDARRLIQASVYEQPDDKPTDYTENWVGGAMAYCGGKYPVSNKIEKLSFLYWPSRKEACINIGCDSIIYGKPAAAGISIYEVTKDLPAMEITGKGGRLIGPYNENPGAQLLSTFYAGSDKESFKHVSGWQAWQMKEWMMISENLVKYLRMNGLNAYTCLSLMYDRPNFPCRSTTAAHEREGYWTDFIGLLAKTFEYNGIKLMLDTRLANLRYFDERVISDEEATGGAPGLRSVSRDGRQVRNYIGEVGLNPFHPEVEEHCFRYLDEVLDRYGRYKSLAGIGVDFVWDTWPSIGVPEDSRGIYGGYDDLTIALFEKEKNIKVPVDGKVAERFIKRYNWLTANMKEEWIKWRCEKVREISMRIYDRIREKRKDLNYHMTIVSPSPWNGVMDNQWFKDGGSVNELLLEYGIDPAMYRGKDGLYIGPVYWRSEEKQRESESMASVSAIRKYNTDSKKYKLFENDGRGFIFICDRYFETGLTNKTDKEWFWRNASPAFVGGQSGIHYREGWAHAMANLDPAVIWYNFSDNVFPVGHEEIIREFVRVFRSIPAGNYRIMDGSAKEPAGGDDDFFRAAGLVGRHAEIDGKGYFYLVNQGYLPLKVRLKTEGTTAKIEELLTGKPVEMGQNNEFVVDMEPYEVKPFTAVPGGIKLSILRYQASLSKEQTEELSRLDGKIDAARKKGLNTKKCEGVVQEITKMLKNEEYSNALALFAGNKDIRLLEEQLDRIEKGGRPWHIIGPFGNDFSEGFDTAYVEEGKECILGKEYRDVSGKAVTWEKYYDGGNDGLIDFDRIYEPNNWVVAYACTGVYSENERPVKLSIGSDDGIKVWLNGKLVHNNFVARGASRGQDKVDANLKKGWNNIMVKVEDRIGGWGFYLDLTGGDGKMLDDLKFGLKEAGK